MVDVWKALKLPLDRTSNVVMFRREKQSAEHCTFPEFQKAAE